MLKVQGLSRAAQVSFVDILLILFVILTTTIVAISHSSNGNSSKCRYAQRLPSFRTGSYTRLRVYPLPVPVYSYRNVPQTPIAVATAPIKTVFLGVSKLIFVVQKATTKPKPMRKAQYSYTIICPEKLF